MKARLRPARTTRPPDFPPSEIALVEPDVAALEVAILQEALERGVALGEDDAAGGVDGALGLERGLGVAIGDARFVGERHARLVAGDRAHGDGELDGPAGLLQRRDRFDVLGRLGPPARQRRDGARVAGEDGEPVAGERQLDVVLAGLGRPGADEVAVAHVDEQHDGPLLDVALEGERQVRVLAAGVDALDLAPVVGEPVEVDGAVFRGAAREIRRPRRRWKQQKEQ